MTALDRIDGISAGVAYKAPVKAVTNAAITLSGEQTVNGVAVVAGDRVLVKDQADNTTNGIYDVAQTAWARSLDFDGQRDVVYGTLVSVASSSDTLVQYRLTTANPIVIGTSAITFAAVQHIDGVDRWDGRTILEASPVTDASAEFLSGATFTLDPTNARHYNIQVGDSETALTAGMTIDLAPDSLEWPETAQVIISKGDSSAYSVTIYGLNVNGLGTTTLSEQYEGIILGYHHTDGENGPGAAGQKWKPVARFTRTRLADTYATVMTAAEWTASSLVLAVGRFGYASDTGSLRVGNGVDVFDDLDSIEGGSDHDAVTLGSTLKVSLTSSTSLISSHTTTGLSSQVLTLNRYCEVDSSGGAIDLTLAASLTVADQIDLDVVDATSTITLKRPTVAVQGTGTTNGTTTVTMADTSPARVGDVAASDVGITSGQTVLSITPNTSVTLSAAADGSVTDETITFTGQRGVFNGSEQDITLRKGFTIAKVTGTTTGIDAKIFGATNEGAGPLTQASITATGNTDMAGTHFGKSLLVTSASGTPTYTFLTEANYGGDIETGTVIKFYWDGAASSFTFVQGSGTTLSKPSTQTLAMQAAGTAVAEYIGSETWVISGALVAA